MSRIEKTQQKSPCEKLIRQAEEVTRQAKNIYKQKKQEVGDRRRRHRPPES